MSDKIEGNSLTQKKREEEPPRVTEAITQAKPRKKKWWDRIIRNIISDEHDNLGDFIIDDVVSPAIGNLIVDSLVGSIKMVFGGGSDTRRGSSRADRVSYRDYYDDDRGRRRRRDDGDRGLRVLDDAVVETRGEAEKVLDRMDDIIDQYGSVSVADLCDLVGLPHDYTMVKYGWKSINSAKAVRVRDGYLIQLPNPRPLD